MSGARKCDSSHHIVGDYHCDSNRGLQPLFETQDKFGDWPLGVDAVEKLGDISGVPAAGR